jgi:hypothetical protein
MSKPKTEEHRKNMSKAHMGMKMSPEARKNMSKAQSGENNPNYGKTGTAAAFYGKKHTEETRRKISEALKNKKKPHGRSLWDDI